MNSDEQIQCKKCGDGTNDCPDDFPPECKGYCPHCAIVGWEEGWLPKPTNQAMKNYLLAALANKLERLGGILIRVEAEQVPPHIVSPIPGVFLINECLN